MVLHGVGVLLVTRRGSIWGSRTHNTTVSSKPYSSSSSRQFLDLSDLHSVIINEVRLKLVRGVVWWSVHTGVSPEAACVGVCAA